MKKNKENISLTRKIKRSTINFCAKCLSVVYLWGIMLLTGGGKN